jgi:hypothetical protein
LQADGIDANRYFEQVGLRTTVDNTHDAESGASGDASSVPETPVVPSGSPSDTQSPGMNVPNDDDDIPPKQEGEQL